MLCARLLLRTVCDRIFMGVYYDAAVRALDFRPSGSGFNSRSGVIRIPSQLSLPSIRVGKSSTSLHRLGLRRGVLAYVWLQVKLCDTILR